MKSLNNQALDKQPKVLTSRCDVVTHTVLLFVGLALFAMLTGCSQENISISPVSETGQTFTCTISGIVTDSDRTPIVGAVVSYNGSEVTTDQYGFYDLKDVPVNSTHNHLLIGKEGYFDNSLTFRVDKDKSLTQETVLVKKQYEYEFQSTKSSVIQSSKVQLAFPPNSMVYDVNSKTYSGMVKVAVKYIDPTHSDAFMETPGDMSGINENGDLESILSFGNVYVSLATPSGEKLQIKEGSTVEMTVDLPTVLQPNAPELLTMHSFDYNQGLWIEKGTAVKHGNQYTTQVNHFSCWSYGSSRPSVTISGRIIDRDGNPVPKSQILFATSKNGWDAHGTVNSDGTFFGRVPKGVTLYAYTIHGNSRCLTSKSYIGEFGPFYSYTKIGDVLEGEIPDPKKSAKIKGRFLDCDNKPISKGFIKIGFQYIPINDGDVNTTITLCANRPNSIPIQIIDRESQTTMFFEPTFNANVIDLGIVSLCDYPTDFLSLSCPDLNFYDAVFDNLHFSTKSPMTWLSGNDNLSGNAFVISFENNGQEEGEFPIVTASAFMNTNLDRDPNFPKDYMNDGKGKITINKDENKRIYYGSYQMTISNMKFTDTQTFTGKFRYTY